MKRATLLGVAAIALWSVGAFAQGRDFGGTWTIDQEKTAASQPAGAAGAMRGGGGGGRGGAAVATTTATGGEVRTAGAAAGGFVAAGGGGARGGGGAGAPTEAAAVRTVPQTTISLNAQANTFSVGNGQTTTEYKLDGTAQTIAGGAATAKAAWKADKLVIETTRTTDNGPIVSTATWYREGDWLVRETSSPGPNNGDPIVRKTYFKKAS